MIKICPECKGNVYKRFMEVETDGVTGRHVWEVYGGLCVKCSKEFTLKEWKKLE